MEARLVANMQANAKSQTETTPQLLKSEVEAQQKQYQTALSTCRQRRRSM